jgi:type I site-specific restriction endonuclease
VGWNLGDGRSVHFEYTLDDSTRADYVLADRHGLSKAVMEAKRASVNHRGASHART